MIDDTKIEELREEMEENTQLMVAYMERDDETGDIELFVQTDETIEDLFRTEETETSSEWHMTADTYHTFYTKDYDPDMEAFMRDKLDHYGNEYIKNENVNLAILRTEGISDGRVFKINGRYSEESIRRGMTQLKHDVKQLYQQMVQPVAVKTSLTIREL